jgi:hypothetical protein
MRHETALKRLDELDAGQRPGFGLGIHLAKCPSCARAAQEMSEALSAYREEARLDARDGGASGIPREADRLIEERVMASIRLTHPPMQDFAIRDWLFPGAVILLSMCLLPLGSSLGYFTSFISTGNALFLSLVLGLVFTAYCVLFIASHVGELQSYLRERGLLPR